MIFNSLAFLIFIILVFIFYWSLRKKPLVYQNILLLIASYVFYGWWDWRFLGLIAFSTLVDFYVGKTINNSNSLKTKKIFLYISLITNIGLLGFFKYYNFFVKSFEEMLFSFGFNIDTWTLNIILPVGISFYTFQTLSYTIDIYKGKIKHTSNIISFAVFVSFFPQLVAGPIERASHLLPQFLSKRQFNYKEAINGLSLIVYGFFKKIVIADRLAIYVNSVFSDIQNANSISLIFGAIFFAFQIYADFSGYSLIARGISKLLGFDLMVNFNRPYLAETIPDFWRRWHISLSTWFRDYLYIPLGGNRVSVPRNYFNLMVVFLVSGLWHGANWTFVIWGALHGIYQVVYLKVKGFVKIDLRNTIFHKSINILFVFTIVTITWVFFRAESLRQAIEYFNRLFLFDFSFNLVQVCAEKGPLNLILSIFSIILLYLSYLLPKNLVFKNETQSLFFILLTIFIILIIGINGTAEFIYFQF
ncbi:MBOAT family O-acyltransferase [Winogradskyella endarachnes]|uniref:MBOAT family protein n=1 Tax=Winogradskyella endarachnes TaxID=2681965 RepID=A0A6L6U6L2_9FLAO|nr:MBOAT family O-acyltransferase [Winogradskyella endarachnes]MUU77885.1 MBOAT family protein [Winogradskyella endarachnes]